MRALRFTWLGLLGLALEAGLGDFRCFAALPGQTHPDYLLTLWQSEDGLPQNYVTSLAQGPDGYLWIGTYGGLARFDGVRFVAFDALNTPELKHPRVQRLHLDPQGTLWAQTFDGTLTTCREGRFTTVHKAGSGNANMTTRLLWADAGQVMFELTSGRLLRGTGRDGLYQNWETIATPSRAWSALADGHGTVWCRTTNDTVARLAGGHFEVVASGPGSQEGTVTAITVDASGRIWLGTDRGLFRWNGERFENMNPTNDAPEFYVDRVLSARDGSMWIFANQRARRWKDGRWLADAGQWTGRLEQPGANVLYYGDRQGGLWAYLGGAVTHLRADGRVRRITAEDGLPNERATSIIDDQEGNVWLGFNRGGLVRVRERRIQVLGVDEGLANKFAISVAEDAEGALWIANYSGGVCRWKDGKFTQFLIRQGQTPGLTVTVHPDRQGRVWAGVGGYGLWTITGEQAKRPPGNIRIDDTGYGLLVDRDDRVWIGHRGGVSRYADGVTKSFRAADGFNSSEVRAFAESADGTIWIGATDGAIYRHADDRLAGFRAGDGLGRQPVWSMLSDVDGTLWIGTYRGGLLRFKDGQFTRVTTEQGLPSDTICQVLDDDAGQLWLSSHKGIFRVAKAALNAFASGEVRTVPCVAYGLQDGLPTLECSGNYQPAGWKGRDGRLWFATVNGVVSLHPREMGANPVAPPVVIEGISVDGTSLDSKLVHHNSTNATNRRVAIWNREQGTVELGPGRHQIEFRFTGLSLGAPEQVQFQYKLEGLDPDWNRGGNRRAASYAYLPPGKYRFRVTACNSDGLWNEAGDALVLTVRSYFWETGWFLGALGVLAAGGIAGTARFVSHRRLRRRMERLEQQRSLERERSRIAQDLHDDLGSSLTEISMLAAMPHSGGEDVSQNGDGNLSQISSKADRLVRALDEIVWAVNPKHDSVASLADYLSGQAQDFLGAAGIRARLDVQRDLPIATLKPEQRHGIYLAVKEALNNAARHSGATEVWLRLKVRNRCLSVVVEDNGCGFVANGGGGGGDGLQNFSRRLEALGGECRVESVVGKGTGVHFTLPIKP